MTNNLDSSWVDTELIELVWTFSSDIYSKEYIIGSDAIAQAKQKILQKMNEAKVDGQLKALWSFRDYLSSSTQMHQLETQFDAIYAVISDRIEDLKDERAQLNSLESKS